MNDSFDGIPISNFDYFGDESLIIKGKLRRIFELE